MTKLKNSDRNDQSALIDDAKGKGASVLTGGKRSTKFEKGYFFEPTILKGLPDTARVMSEEPFAPVMPILDFSKIDDVIAAANNTPYGLSAAPRGHTSGPPKPDPRCRWIGS